MEALKWGNLALRFILELLALVALAYWGFRPGRRTAVRWILGLGIPLAAVVLWILFVAPEPVLDAPVAWVIAIEAAILGGAALALMATGHLTLGLTYALVVLANRILLGVWNQ